MGTSTHEQISNRFVQPLEVDWLGEMLGKTSSARQADVVFHSESAQRDPAQRVCRSQFLHQFVAAAIGQTNVADQQIKLLALRLPDRLVGCVSERNPVAAALQEHFHPETRVLMIVHHQEMAFARGLLLILVSRTGRGG